LHWQAQQLRGSPTAAKPALASARRAVRYSSSSLNGSTSRLIPEALSESAKRKGFKKLGPLLVDQAAERYDVPDNVEAPGLSYLHRDGVSNTKPKAPGNRRASNVQHAKSLTRAHSQAWDKETQNLKPTLQSTTAMPTPNKSLRKTSGCIQ
jgi:hypothetical protein